MNILNHEQLKVVAPSIFATNPLHKMSDKYEMVRTIDVIDSMAADGWHPVHATQKKARHSVDKAKHMVRLRNENLSPIGARSSYDKVHPEIVLTNSHNGACSYQVMAGLFRMICMNGLVVSDATFANIKVRHMNFNATEIHEAAAKVIEHVPELAKRIKRLTGIKLTEKQELEFAERMMAVKYPFRSPYEPAAILERRRKADAHNDLWTVANVLQENLMKGGVVGAAESGRQVTSVEVKDLNVHLNLNRGIWQATDEYALELEGAA